MERIKSIFKIQIKMAEEYDLFFVIYTNVQKNRNFEYVIYKNSNKFTIFLLGISITSLNPG